MATNKELAEGVEILFADGVKRRVKPLTIRQLRSFMKIVSKIQTTEDRELTDDDIDNMVAAAAIALKKVDPDLSENEDELEETLDLRCFAELMAAAMGEDPNG